MSETTPEQTPAPEEATPARRRFTRRRFLIGVGVAGAGLVLGVPLGLPVLRRQIAERFDGPASYSGGPDEPFAWFEILPTEQVRIYIPKVEMGQGVHTALAQIAADELEVPWENLEVLQGTTHRGPADSFGTAGSTSVASMYQPLRQGAAALREMLRTQAAAHLGVPAVKLVVRAGAFEYPDDPTLRVTYGTLVAQPVDWQMPEDPAPLKPASEFHTIGQSMPRVDLPAKITGQAMYGYDARSEGMLYGAVARPPTLEARLIAAQAGAAEQMPGVVQVVIEEGFAGVVARSRAEAAAARDALQLTWDEGHRWEQAEIDQIVTVGNGTEVTIQKEGDAGQVLQQGSAFTAEYRTPFAVQTPLEPQAALADVGSDYVKVWASTQGANWVQDAVAKALEMNPEQIEVIPTFVGGGFGRKAGTEAAVEAARLSRAAGVPVHMGWDRTEEMRYGYFRPSTHHQLRGRLDSQGRILALEHRQASGDVAFGFVPKIAEIIMGADFGAWRGARIFYAVPHRRTIAYRTPVPVRTGWWRGLGLFANTFALESFVDELAHQAGADPLQFRLDHLPTDARGQRFRRVLEAVAQQAGWGSALPAGAARGIACCIDVDTVVAQVAEVSLEPEAGKVRVHRIVAAMDCGRVINPDGARAQMEGNIIWGVGSTLIEQMTIRAGQVDITNFDEYPLLTIREAPEIETVLLEAPDGIPRGVGEPPIGPTGAAVANAFYALTGVRIRQLPMTPERVKAALRI